MLTKLFGKNPPSKLLKLLTIDDSVDRMIFGDSVFIRTETDPSIPSLNDLIKNASLATVIAESGLASPHFLSVILKNLDKIKKNTKNIVISVNVRSFSPQWEFNPDWAYENLIRDVLPDGVLSTISPKTNTYDYRFNRYANYYLYGRRNIEFMKQIKKFNDTTSFLESRKRLYSLHYLFDINTIYESLRYMALKEIVKVLKSSAVRVVFLVLPVNYKGIEYLLGDEGLQVLERNINCIVAEFEKSVSVVNASKIIDQHGFFNEIDTTEHLNSNGRTQLFEYLTRNCFT
jgi:hypothetical protein